MNFEKSFNGEVAMKFMNNSCHIFKSKLYIFFSLVVFVRFREFCECCLIQWFANCFVSPRKFAFSICQNFPLETVKISFSKLSKFPIPNCQNFSFQTIKISLSKLSKFPFRNCQNFLFQTVKISHSKLSKFPFPNCQNFPFQTVKISLYQTVKFSIFKEHEENRVGVSRVKKFEKHWV
jgi:hypothetical protein